MSKRVAILTSGGDAPGMNACIRAAIIACQKANYTLLGYKHGYNGLLQQEYIPLSLDSTHNLIQQGGTILHSARCKELKSQEGIKKAANNLMKAEIDTLIVIGGDGSFRGAAELGKEWDGLDSIVHSVGFAPRELLQGNYLENLTRGGYQTAMDVSSYSFAALGKAGRDMMQGRDASLLTLSYLGAIRAMNNYNVMGVAKAALEANVRYMAHALGTDGIRVNGISAGPIKTLAASGIGNFKSMLDHVEKAAPLKRSVTQMDVAKAAAFLCSDWASGITGEITYVDCGWNTLGMSGLNSAE